MSIKQYFKLTIAKDDIFSRLLMVHIIKYIIDHIILTHHHRNASYA